MQNRWKVFTNGLLKENPTLRLVLGTCPTLAVTTMAFNGLGMGLAATFVLLCSNMVISALRKVIPQQVRIPCYITIIAGFVTVVQMLMKAYLYDLYAALGVFLPLIVVNCIILGRAEMFASKHDVLSSALDGLGMGLGFTLVLTLMGTVREILGSGTWMAGLGAQPLLDISAKVPPMAIFSKAPGGFFVFGCFMALAAALDRGNGQSVDGCAVCPAAASCPAAGKGESCPPAAQEEAFTPVPPSQADNTAPAAETETAAPQAGEGAKASPANNDGDAAPYAAEQKAADAGEGEESAAPAHADGENTAAIDAMGEGDGTDAAGEKGV